MGCLAQSGPGTDPDLNFLTYPLKPSTAAAAKGTLQYQITDAAKKRVDESYVLWISPSGSSLIGVWNLYVKGGAFVDSPNGTHVGVMSHGKFTPLRFPAGFDLAATDGTIAW